METEAQFNSKEQSADRLATASFVMGIISIVSVLCCCPFVFSAIGIVLALLSKGASDALRPRAKTGLILSIAGLVISFVRTRPTRNSARISIMLWKSLFSRMRNCSDRSTVMMSMNRCSRSSRRTAFDRNKRIWEFTINRIHLRIIRRRLERRLC